MKKSLSPDFRQSNSAVTTTFFFLFLHNVLFWLLPVIYPCIIFWFLYFFRGCVSLHTWIECLALPGTNIHTYICTPARPPARLYVHLSIHPSDLEANNILYSPKSVLTGQAQHDALTHSFLMPSVSPHPSFSNNFTMFILRPQTFFVCLKEEHSWVSLVLLASVQFSREGKWKLSLFDPA